MTGFLIATQFLTCLPLPFRAKVDAAAMGRSMRWFPAVGALMGLGLALIDAALTPILSPELRAALLVGLLILLTGALHMDGLMDSCDAVLAPVPAERRLEILWDSRVGSFAVVGAATALLLKYAAILAVPPESRVATLVAIIALSRWSMVYATVRYPAARSTGLGHAYKAGVGPRELAIATALALFAAFPSGIAGLAALLLAWVTTVLIARAIMTKIPGLTGDTYGAICESVEITVAIWLPVFHRLFEAISTGPPGLL
jgi:adenosylcobinamide-GDP ribazoletransferase